MNNIGLWIGFFLAVAAATAMLSYMLWYQGSHHQLEPRRVKRAIIQVWAAVAVGLAVGVGLRAALGGEVIALGRNPDAPLGVWVRTLWTHESVAMGVALAIMALCFVWALRAVRSVTEPHQGKQDSNEGKTTP